MKKRFLAITLILSTLLFGCGMAFTLAGIPGAEDTELEIDTQEPPSPLADTDAQEPAADDSVIKTEQVDSFSAISLRTSGSAPRSAVVIGNTSGLKSYYDENRVAFSLDKRCGTLSFEEAMAQYADTFFNDRVLLILRLSEDDVTMVPQVRGVNSDGLIYIERTADPSVTAGSRQWHILLSLPISHSALENGSFQIIEY